jgi:glucose/arabinose dehydrogenase
LPERKGCAIDPGKEIERRGRIHGKLRPFMNRAARTGIGFGLGMVFAASIAVSCSDPAEGPSDGGADASRDVLRDGLPYLDGMLPDSYCALPGSIVGTANGMAIVPGGDPSLPDLSWLTVPEGYCAHHFANVPETRQLRVAPGGDLFVASPSTPTAGGEQHPGKGAVLVLPDDDHDGLADTQIPFVSNIPSTQGLTFSGGYFYFQDGLSIKRVPFASGDRTPTAAPQTVTTFYAPPDPKAPPLPVASTVVSQSGGHWPKVLDVAADGTLYVANGSDQGETCYSPAKRNPWGAIFKIGSDGQGTVVNSGFRNPIALRCEPTHNVCLIAELAKDGSGSEGGREKLVPVRQGDDWGFPCCAAPNTPYSGMTFQDNQQSVKASDCAGVTQEDVSFRIGHTPFGIDFEQGALAEPWGGRVFVALHGDVGTYFGSRVVAIALDPNTGLPLQASDVESGISSAPNMMDFVTGWDDGHQGHGRATAVAFGPDGRLYVGADTLGEIFWVAPVTLKRP